MTDAEAPIVDNARLAQRLQDMARVAGRLAHDFDNILTGVIGFAELTQPLVPAGNARQHLGELHRVGLQGVELTRRMHQLSRAAGITPRPGTSARLLDDLRRRWQETLPTNVALEVRSPQDGPSMSIDAESMRVVLDELVRNGVEACFSGGNVRIDTDVVSLSDQEAASLLGNAGHGRHFVIRVADSGLGISPDVRSRIFVDACYTTKPRHRGLGLAIVYRIVHAHRGGFSLVAGPAGGTVASVFLPLNGSNGL